MLAQHFDNVVALDVSIEVFRLAPELATLDNVELRLPICDRSISA
jgi:hypothetical protein